MKIQSLLYLFLAFGLLGWAGCEDDDATIVSTLNYDGNNFTAPQFPVGTNQFGVYFPPSETQPFIGETLEKVTFYLTEIPASTTVIVYAEGSDDRSPGRELYRKDITQRVRNTGWVEDFIDPVTITDEGLWLVIEVELEGTAGQFYRSVGCDQGQGYPGTNASLLMTEATREWIGFEELNGEQVNWNIRGILAE